MVLGLISRELIPHVKSIIGVDITQGLVDQYNLRVSNQGLDPSEMKAIRAELKENDPQLGDTKFDVIVVCFDVMRSYCQKFKVSSVLSGIPSPRRR